MSALHGGTHPGGADLLVQNARSYPPGPASRSVELLIQAGRIDAHWSDGDGGAPLSAPEGTPTLDARGLTLIPGLIDVHVHFRDPGLTHKEGWDCGSRGALHGGVTSVVEVQNNPPLSVSRAALEGRIAHVRKSSRVDFGCLANLLPDSVDELPGMTGLTPALKLFLGGSTGLGGQTDRGTLRSLFAAAARAGRMVVAHCEDEELLQADKRAHPGATANEHHIVRSIEAEVRSIKTAMELCEETGARLHVFHISSAEGVQLVRAGNQRGIKIGASTAPHYLLLSAEDAPRLGNLLKVNPSIKPEGAAAGILAGLIDGTVEAIGTDHAPHPLEDKLRDYKHAPSGMPSVDLLWPLTYELVRRGLLPAETALEVVTSRAADSLGILGKGRLEPGADGDLVLFDPGETRRVVGSELPSRSKWSAYEGQELAGFPQIVVRRGTCVFRDGETQVEAGGEPLMQRAPSPLE